jgi:phage gp29-like protein
LPGIAIYDEMRRSDGTVRAAVSVCALPIRSAKWYVEPASEDASDAEIAEFVWKCFSEYQSITFNDLMRHALLSLPFGVMAFEKVFAVRDLDGQTRIVWDKLAPRMPKSIQKWAIGNDDEPGIRQLKSNSDTVDIPLDKLVVIVNEKEGDNWWGTSILRPAYKHWFIKNTIYKIDAIAFERQGLGVPFVKLPENYTEADRSKAEEIVKNLRVNQQVFILEPFEYEIGFKDMMAKSVRDPAPSIEHHNREIMKSVLAQFLELGSTNKSGSRALSEDHSAMFLQSLETVAQGIADAFNKYAVEEIVDLNFNNVKAYPKLAFTRISRVDAAAIATTYQTLTTTGAIKIGSKDEQFFREQLSLPERDPDDIVEPPTDDTDVDDPDEALKKAQKEAAERIVGTIKKT